MNVPDPLARVLFRGKVMDRKTAAALAIAEQRLGYELTVVQGSYNSSVEQSAGTHDRGGTVDLAAWDGPRKVRVLIDLGFAAYRRLPSEGPWPEHIHAVMIGHQDLAPSAARQVESFKAGRNGLANNALDRNRYRPEVAPFNYRAAWRDDLLVQRIKGLRARRRALRDKISAAKARITYRTKAKR